MGMYLELICLARRCSIMRVSRVRVGMDQTGRSGRMSMLIVESKAATRLSSNINGSINSNSNPNIRERRVRRIGDLSLRGITMFLNSRGSTSLNISYRQRSRDWRGVARRTPY